MNITALEAAFAANFATRGELGASVSVWRGGEEIVTLCGGSRDRSGELPWTPDTAVPIYSATKGPAAATVLLALDEAGLDLDQRVADVWSGFPSQATFGEVLSHRAGFAALDQPADATDYDSVIAAIEAQTPSGLYGYHPRTIGFIMDEIVRRLTAKSLGTLFHEKIASPLDLEIWIGGEPPQTVAELVPPRVKPGAEVTEFYKAYATKGTPTQRAFTSPGGLAAVSAMNRPATWALGLPAMGGLATARGLAKFYAYAASGKNRFRETMETTLASGSDTTLLAETAFSAGFMKHPLPGSPRTFGHPGAGGSLAFGDPDSGIGFAYVMNQMVPGALPSEKALSLAGTII